MIQDYLNELKKAWKDQKMMDHFRKSTSRVIRLTDDGLMPFEKMKIQKDFCFGYHLSSHDTEDFDRANKMADHAANSQAYFIAENLKDINRAIGILQDPDGDDIYLYRISYYSEEAPLNCWRWIALSYINYEYGVCRGWYRDIKPCSLEDRALILDALESEKKDFERRLRSYLKRYGMKNVNSWSYWRDL